MGLIDDVPSCAELIARMVADAEAIITKRLPSVVVAAGVVGRAERGRVGHAGVCVGRVRREALPAVLRLGVGLNRRSLDRRPRGHGGRRGRR